MQDLVSMVGGGKQQRSCWTENSLQLQRYEMARFREVGTLTGMVFGRPKLSNSLR